MVDLELRYKLSQDVRLLITGRLTNDEFDDAYYEQYTDSKDMAVREISRFFRGLYSSDLPLSYRLRGIHAVDAATRKKAAHAVLFLQTDFDYVYPETPEVGSASFGGGLFGIAFLVMALLFALGGAFDTAANCAMIGVGILAICAFLGWAQNRLHQPYRNNFNAAGDTSVWPFHDGESVKSANGNNYLLSNFNPEITT